MRDDTAPPPPALAVLTSGGDAPGMNAALRAVVRVAVARGIAVHGVRRGFSGLIDGDFVALGARDVGGIVQRAGTVLGSARCVEMRGEAGQVQALEQLRQRGIGALVVIGGNGSQSGAFALAQRGLRVVGVASTIDNDMVGSDPSIGSSSAIDVALESVDRLRVTGASHRRGFLVEVMGRDCGHLACVVGIASGAEAIVVPEQPVSAAELAAQIQAAYARGKSHAIVIVAEGARPDAEALARHFDAHHEQLGFRMRLCRLGHVQRGGAPGVSDRMLGTQLGAAAVAALCAGTHGVLTGQLNGQVAATPLAEVANRTRPVDPELVDLAQLLAR